MNLYHFLVLFCNTKGIVFAIVMLSFVLCNLQNIS